jgi:malate dehydrogenase (oxaloacetate-decarboxylating)
MPQNMMGLRGFALLENPILNKGSAFSEEEREAYGLRGLLPPHVETIEEQAERAYAAYLECETDLHKHIYLRQLQDANEVLFYYLLQQHIEEMLPIVYTPTVGTACERFSSIYRRARGLFISYHHKGKIREVLANRPNREVDVIVVSDGERILGLGDQGAGGMGIPIGKLSLYCLIGGIHPMRTLPIILDVGTNNKELLRDPLYIGWRHERITGEEYYNFVDEFVEAVKTEMPNVCLQWEDFATPHARPLLEKYRNDILTFNDDVQGTAAVALGAVIGALNVVGQSLRDQQIVFLGAGSAGIGVADYLRAAMVKLGLSDEEACRKFHIVDKDGLLHDRRTNLLPEQRPYAQPWSIVEQWPRTMDGNIGLADVVGQISASVLIGLSAVGGAFKQEIIETMASKVARPIIFPLSNPTSRAEATPQDLLSWTKGRALIATGSPFSNVSYNGQKFSISQCNNVYIFPAVGLALVACGASRVTDTMLIAAAEVLGSLSPAIKDAREPLLPRVRDVRKVAAHIAFAVACAAIQDGVAPAQTDDQLKQAIEERQWRPSYE